MLTLNAVNRFKSSTNSVSKCILTVSLLLCVSSLSYATDMAKSFPEYKIEELATKLSFPWSLAFLPNGELLVTERSGQLRIVSRGGISEPLKGLPDDIYVKSQGGLLEVAIHPQYAQNGWIYLSYAVGSDDNNALRLLRGKLKEQELVQQQILFTVSPYKNTPVHFAGRMTFLPDNTLLLTSGDGFDFREDAQRLNNQLGKIIRINDDGSLPADNPFVDGKQGELSRYVYSYGHRNSQAIVYDPIRKLIFSNEHGPDGGDEINIIEAGKNYGWPVITYGRDYSGANISPFKEYPGMQQPFVDWTPSIAPSGMAVHSGNMFHSVNGDLLASSLKFKEVRWLQMEGNLVRAQVSLFKELNERIRDVRVHSDGSIYLLTDSAEGKILRVVMK
ncbi:MAG: glucose/arabinose dehydrogenase [Paraglaciecola sp.]|jgi:glucose/arabinose dehydrogenase